jgi:sarcosine oxidase subunit alpha
MARTTAFGAYDNGVFGLIERVSDHLARPEPYQPRQRFWILRTRQAILATGMVERPLVFGNNDLPGVMLASAARSYVNRYAVSLGRAVVVFTTNDSAYEAALACAGAGAKVYVVDVRPDVPADLRRTAQEAGIALYLGCAVATAHGRARVRSVDVVDYFVAQGKSGALRGRLACDGLLVSGGWTPTLQLLGQRGCKPTYDDELATFVAKQVPDGYRLTGGAAGVLRLDRSVEHAWETGQLAAQACDLTAAPPEPSLLDGLSSEGKSGPLAPVWSIADADSSGRKKKFIDFQHDVTLGDISQALQEGYDTVDHLKRYTTLGMATDQGKTSNVNALGIVAEMLQLPLNAIGTTTFRPPFRPIAIGALAGSEFGPHFKPVRRSPMHDWHERHGAVFTDTGLWRRPWYYPKPGESVREASAREAGGVRQFLGIVDISSLGKIDVQGPDAVHFLDRVYVNGWATLPVGKARYGVMLRADGIVLDDGTTSRLSEQHYFMTSTTSGAGKVMTHLEYLLQTAWPELKVHVTSVTSQWAAIAVAGPRSRDLLSRLVADCDFRSAAFPFMGVRNGTLGGLPVRILRVSFSGELAYELYTPAGYGEQLWTALWEAGQAMGIGAYGTEALGMLRIEKGHVAGAEIDGRTTLADLGLGDMASKKKPYIGSALARRDALVDPQRPQLVGLEPSAPGARLRAGAILCEPGRHTGHGIGFVSSVTYSSELGRHIGLGFVAGGMARQGDAIDAVFALRNEVTAVRVTSPRFVDPREERLHA